MSEPRTQQEPSMEEILASIRRIISEDGSQDEANEAANGDASADTLDDTDDLGAESFDSEALDVEPLDAEPMAEAVEDLAEPAADDDILELTDIVDDAASGPEPIPPQAQPDPMDLNEADMTMEPDGAGDDRMISPAAAAAATSAFSSLLARPEGGRDLGSMPIGDGNTVEAIVRELLRPMLQEWLETNLPSLVERLVQREVEAISRDATRR